MNLIFAVMAIISLIVMTVIDPENAYSAMLGGAQNAISLAFKLAAIYCIWLSVLDIMEKTNVNKFLHKLFSPMTKLLFRKEDEKTQELLDKLPVEDKQEDLIEILQLKTAIAGLSERDRKVIMLRYFRDMTQNEVANMLGVSQVQVSRIENRIMENFRKDLTG